MDKTAIRSFATWARNELIDKVSQKAKIYGIEKDKEIEREMDTALNEQILSPDEKKARRELINKIEENTFEQVIEEVAYTWFNRFIAIRFMEVNGYMPSHIRVFTSEDNEFEPQILTEAIHIDLIGLDKAKVLDLYNQGNKEEELFKYLFITQCNALSEVLPGIFQKISDYTELLIPDGLLREGSVIDKMIKDIAEEDWKEQVQIIGWLYQYYISEQKDEVFSRPKSKKIEKEDIPAATQLFTPDWIVRYMVENSLGRLWLEGHPDEELQSNWKYYLEEAEQEKEAEEELIQIRKQYSEMSPEDIKCIDPCIGSGHIGAYLFDVLMQIYESYGYKTRDAVRLILEKNIYGLDIDERARQLAYFSLMMKARQYDRRFLIREDIAQPNIYTVEQSNYFKTGPGKEIINYFANGDNDLQNDIESIIKELEDAKEYGSIVNVKPVNFRKLYERFEEIKDDNRLDVDAILISTKLLPLVKQAEVLSDKYDVVVTNPPYLVSSGMNAKLSKYVKTNYKDSKSDLFAVFIEICSRMTKKDKFTAMITQHSWMFISSYEKLRKKLLEINTVNMAHLGPRAFEEIKGEVVQTTSFVFRNNKIDGYKGTYVRLIEANSQDKKEEMFLSGENRYITEEDNFKKIPGSPIAYWISDKYLDLFSGSTIKDNTFHICKGIYTGNNEFFIRYWHEVLGNDIGKQWLIYGKGGIGRNWYGNYHEVLNWKDNGRQLREYAKSGLGASKYFGMNTIVWGKIGSGKTRFRFNSIEPFDDGTPAIIFKDNIDCYLLGYLNTKIMNEVLKIIAPTLNVQIGDIRNSPYPKKNKISIEIVKELAEENIKLSKLDWDMHEISWDFENSPLLTNKIDGKIESAYQSYKTEVNKRFQKLKENEEELNRIFIEIYELEDELDPYVSDKDITVAKIFDDKKDIDDEIKGNRYVMTREDVVKNFLSYFIGCAMGRYSLDEEGLIFAGGDFDPSKYKSFKPSEDGIISLTDKEYFEDDILALFVDFLKVTFGEENLNENLDFIAAELTKKSYTNSREVIRNYFVNNFFDDHKNMYKNLPIYWQYDSGKANACKGLFYLHRYEKDTFAKIRINYIFELQDRYKQELARLEESLKVAEEKERIGLQKEIDILKKRIIESEKFEEKVQHIADSYIELDLDDGVKENYKIFKDVLSKI